MLFQVEPEMNNNSQNEEINHTIRVFRAQTFSMSLLKVIKWSISASKLKILCYIY